MKNNVCLVTPPSAFLLDERVFPHLGILRIAAVLKQSGYHVDVLDTSGYSNYLDIVRHYAATSSTRMFGITATTPQMPAAARIARVLREELPDTRRILGGPHVTLAHAGLKQEQNRDIVGGRAARAVSQLDELFDVQVIGDGEKAIFLACDEAAPKVIDADDRKSNLFLTNEDFERLPYPARELIDLSSYHYTIDGVKATSLIAQLGCPFGCRFCAGRSSPFLRGIRRRGVASIIGEMEYLYKEYGYTGFMFYDDELNVNPGLVVLMQKISRLQDRLGVKFKLRGFIKAELFTDEQAEAMYQAGFRWILTGFESGSPRILVNINKRATVDDNTRCVEIAHRRGLKVKALMSIGHPGESRETLYETAAWLLLVKPDDFDITTITPYPGSPYYDDAVQSQCADGVWVYNCPGSYDHLYMEEIDYLKDVDCYKGIPGEGVSHVWTDCLTQEDIAERRDRMEADVRRALNIPFNPSAASRQFEHSMGMSLPPSILRTTA